jgi:hypothetical protein
MVIARIECSVGGLHHEEPRKYQLQTRLFRRSERVKSAASDNKALQARRGASRGNADRRDLSRAISVSNFDLTATAKERIRISDGPYNLIRLRRHRKASNLTILLV